MCVTDLSPAADFFLNHRRAVAARPGSSSFFLVFHPRQSNTNTNHFFS
jgi:hypothetical protein